LAFMGGLIPGPRKPRAPVAALEPVAPPPPPEPAPVAAPDPRELAIQFVKAWTTPKGRVLGRALEELAPSAGNLSPWMADPLAGGRVQVNYFARSSAPGAPTIAYEFEVDLGEKTLVGRNAAAKSVLSGKATAPPKPPKSRPVRVKPKPSAAKRAPEGDALDAMLGGVPAGSAAQGADQEPTMPGVDAPPAAPVPARRAAKARGEAQADDETLLDDLLKE
ncbi:MAG: hypothetical protein HY403_07215, partial [Elusimicrobia bacterium]|nr:hypothetical protein [Elusimicrobiota bacterium]